MELNEKEMFIDWLKALNDANLQLIKGLSAISENQTIYNEKYKVADFSKIIGCSVKTVYSFIRRNEVKTTKEKVRGRNTTFVIASNKEIQKIRTEYRNILKKLDLI